MGTLLVVDGSDICRAPIVAFTMRHAIRDAQVDSRGLTAHVDSTMCENAASRIGFSGPAIAFYGAHRALPLTVSDIAEADLVLTAERAHRSAVVRMLPGTQAAVFTWKEALALSTVLVDRVRMDRAALPDDLPMLARALHGVRGTVPLNEPAVRTGVFHWRRAAGADPLTVESGHEGRAEHWKVTQESLDVASALGLRLAQLLPTTVPSRDSEVPTQPRRHQFRRTA